MCNKLMSAYGSPPTCTVDFGHGEIGFHGAREAKDDLLEVHGLREVSIAIYFVWQGYQQEGMGLI